jgi:hypothetical protein
MSTGLNRVVDAVVEQFKIDLDRDVDADPPLTEPGTGYTGLRFQANGHTFFVYVCFKFQMQPDQCSVDLSKLGNALSTSKNRKVRVMEDSIHIL